MFNMLLCTGRQYYDSLHFGLGMTRGSAATRVRLMWEDAETTLCEGFSCVQLLFLRFVERSALHYTAGKTCIVILVGVGVKKRKGRNRTSALRRYEYPPSVAGVRPQRL